MNKATIVWIVLAAIIVLGGGYWWWSMSMQNPTSATNLTPPGSGLPPQAGTNGSPDQGNLGGSNTGTPPGPGSSSGDGSTVSQNLALGTDSNAAVGGKYLIGYTGMTVYTYSKDSAGTTTCYSTCAQNWPPYTVPAGSVLNLQAGVTGAIGTIARTDGTIQVTYKGMPLYFYVGDQTGSDVNGNGIGGVWYVAKP
jgi:predicted lipoprotein with Yx(FWY)xxD motif